MEPKIGDKMKVSPQLTAQSDWIDGEMIAVSLSNDDVVFRHEGGTGMEVHCGNIVRLFVIF